MLGFKLCSACKGGRGGDEDHYDVELRKRCSIRPFVIVLQARMIRCDCDDVVWAS